MVASPSSLIREMPRIRPQWELADQMGAIFDGDTHALARAITLVEDRDPAAWSLLRAVFPYTGGAKKIGITGPPGVGKSTLSARIASLYRRQRHDVAILAIDPSSPFTGGAMLGDRIRMHVQAHDPGIYFRSMAARGHLGGLAAAAAEVLDLLDAAGFDRILVESVGAGQDEVEIASSVDALLLVMAPGLGDSLQLLKSGLNEVADIFVTNKCDHPEAEGLQTDIRAALELASRNDGWRVPATMTNAGAGNGIVSLVELIEAYLRFNEQTENAHAKSIERWKTRILYGVREAIEQQLISDDLRRRIANCANRVVNENANPYELVEGILAEIMPPANDFNIEACQ